jgi:HEAT repeat protein
MPAFNWDSFENDLYEGLRLSLVQLGREHPAERYYAVALYGVYRELDHLLSLPHLAAAPDEGPHVTGDADFWSKRFNPADWPHTELGGADALLTQLEAALTAEATRDSVEHWNATEARYFEVLVRVALRLRDAAPTLVKVTDDFVCYWHDEEGGPDMAAKTIPPALYARLFERQVRDHEARLVVADKPLEERIEFLISRFGKFEGVTSEDAQRELLKLGEPSVAALTRAVAAASGNMRWLAAKLLGQIGVADPATIDVLRQHAEVPWCASALGMLGDDTWLATQPPAIATQGLTARLRAISATNALLAYGPLERYLDGADAAARELVEKHLAPGTSYITITNNDVAEAVRGSTSTHAVVRWHAAAVMHDRGLGAPAGKVILPALAAQLADPHPLVRRLAVLALADWKRAAKPYRAFVEKLREDPDATARRTALELLAD